MSADLEFQKVIRAAVVAQLTSDGRSATVTAHAPPDLALPIVEIGESSLGDHPLGHEIQATIHIWSKVEGPHEAKLLQQSVRSALHATAETESGGFRFTDIREEYTSLFIDRGQEHWHGVQRYRVLASTP
jgi:hypothetical protein